MTATILTIIASVLAIIIGYWKYTRKKLDVKQKLAEEAQKKLDSAHENKNKSDLLDAWGKINRV